MGRSGDSVVMLVDHAVILADQIPVVAIVISVAILVGLVVGAVFLFRGYERLARQSLERKYGDLVIHPDPQPGDVILTYHTYHGFIAWFTQTPHHVALPPEDARRLLGRLLRFNLMWASSVVKRHSIVTWA